MKTARIVVTTLTLLSPLAQGFEMAPGQWEMTVKVNAAGSPDSARTMTIKECITAAEAAAPEATMREEWQNDSCQDGMIEIAGNTLSWQVSCPQPGAGTPVYITGRWVLHTPRHYSNELTIKETEQTTQLHGEARMIGTCD